MTSLPNPFISIHETHFTVDEQSFMTEIEPAPVFIENPSQEYLDSLWTMPIIEVLRAYY